VNPIFKKLNFSNQSSVTVLDAPPSFADALAEMRAITKVSEEAGSGPVEFALAFATTKAQVDAFAEWVANETEGDAIVWAAYPKGTSKKYRCEFNRDNGWDRFGQNGFEPVRMIAIDQDWSALRFRRVTFIKKMTRSFAMTEEGKEKSRSDG
jgi:hypothetical protein